MKGKKFRLASVLRIARLREQAEQREALAAQARQAAAERRERERAAAYEVRPVAEAGEAGDFNERRRLEDLRAVGLKEAQLARADAAVRLAAAREDWLRAARRRQSLERLEERHHAAHAMIAARSAQKALDDLVRIRKGLSR